MKRAPEDERGSERTCIVSGVKAPPEAMLRFALSGEGVVTPDIRRKLPGRGVWTRLGRAAVEKAAAKGAFSRAFKAKASAPADLAATVDRLLEEDALQALALANKAGLVVAGAFKVDEAAGRGGVVGLVQASDGAPDGAAKREKALRAIGETAPVARINLLSSKQLDLALGKANVIHAALNAGAASSAFLERAERLRRYRESEAAPGLGVDTCGAPADAGSGVDEPGDWEHE